MIRAMNFSRRQLKECVDMYLLTSKSYSNCARESGFSKNMFRKLIERAIVERVASDPEVEAIKVKASNNCYDYGGEDGAKISENKYARLRAKRLAFKFSDQQKKEYTTLYAEKELTLKEFCEIEFIPFDMMVDAIECSIKNRLIDEKVLRWLTYNLFDDETAGSILINLDHLLDIREVKDIERQAPKKPEQLSFFDI